LTTDLNRMGVRTGMVLTILSFASLTGSPIAGVLVQRANGSYLYAQCFAAASMAVGGALVVLARLSGTGVVLRVRM
jgi:hypothetical protein